MSKVTPAGMPAQGVFAPTAADDPSLQYGDATRLASAQASVPLPSASIPPAPPSAAPAPAAAPAAPAARAAAPQPGMTPQDLLAMLSGHPTEFPNSPLAPPSAPPTTSLSFKIDALRYLSTLPFAGPEIQTLLKRAQVEYDQAQQQQFMPPAQASGSPMYAGGPGPNDIEQRGPTV